MNRPAPVEVTCRSMRFITQNSTNATLSKFIEELKKYGVTTIVRVCEATYDTTLVEKEGIHVLDWNYEPSGSYVVYSLHHFKYRK
uniref:Uncharacterized protein n=1 Tax=Capra hircus TaxID=9925 RepID=A0A8C2RKL3_CAPHI